MARVQSPPKGPLGFFWPRLERAREERGFVLAFCSLFMTVLLGIGGFSVDIGNWYLHAMRLQRAADAAALAGSVYLPNDFASAKAAAEANLKRNGSDGFDLLITQSSVHPTQLDVRVTEKINNYFTSLLGYKSITISRSASAEFRPYVPMGSPSNVLGIEPITGDSWEKASTKGKQNAYWLAMAGPQQDKGNGDRYSSGNCSSSTANCNTSLAIPNRNLDYTDGEQAYVIRIPDNVVGTLSVQVFDAVFAYVGDQCDQSTLTGASVYNSLYTSGNTPQCTGDQLTNSSHIPSNTTISMYTPELSPSGSQLITTPSCQSKTFPGYKGNIRDKVNPAAGTYDQDFVDTFRKWYTVCQMYVDGATAGGDYLLRINMGPLNTAGINRFAIRVAMLNGSTVDVVKTSYLQIFSKGRLVVYARENSANVTFYLARINSAAAGNTMTVTLFDIGDAAGTTTLQLLPAEDAKNNGVSMSQYSGCMYTPPNSAVYQPTSGGCRITGITSSVYNAQIVNIQVEIPENYTCNDADMNSCWTRLSAVYSANVSDTTSWEVTLDGNPVHLVID